MSEFKVGRIQLTDLEQKDNSQIRFMTLAQQTGAREQSGLTLCDRNSTIFILTTISRLSTAKG